MIMVGSVPSATAIGQKAGTVHVTGPGDNTVSVFNGVTCDAAPAREISPAAAGPMLTQRGAASLGWPGVASMGGGGGSGPGRCGHRRPPDGVVTWTVTLGNGRWS